MFIELVDVLRCPKPHEESWLVLSASRMADRQVVEGELGCHVCQQHYRIQNGVALFGDFARQEPSAMPPAVDDAAMRMAALLGLAQPGGLVALLGQTGSLAATLEMLVGDTQILAINGSPESPDHHATGQVSALRTAFPLPLATGSCRAVALDAAHALPRVLAEVVRVLRPRGRLVLPVDVALPQGLQELARDESQLVAERGEMPGVLVPLELSRRK